MKRCKTCKYAGRAEDRLWRHCAQTGTRVRADEQTCAAYAISAWGYLESIAYAQARMRSMSMRAQEYREMARRATGTTEATRASGTGSRSRVETCTVHCIDIALQIEARAEQLKGRLDMAMQMLDDMASAPGRRALEMRHLERRAWADIAREIGYDERQAQRIYRSALREMQEQMDALGIRE